MFILWKKKKSLGLLALIELLQLVLFPSYLGAKGEVRCRVIKQGCMERRCSLIWLQIKGIRIRYGLQNSKGERFGGILKTDFFKSPL